MAVRFIIIVFLNLLGCSYAGPFSNEMHRFEDDFIKYAKSRYGLEAFGVGGSIPDKIRELTIIFESEKLVEIPEARRLIVVLSDDMLYQLNNDEEIRPYLIKYPADRDMIWPSINFKYEFASDKVYVARVAIVRGNVIYSRKDTIKPGYIDMYRETIEEARQKLASESLLKANF